MKNLFIIKKNGDKEKYRFIKIEKAVRKSAERVGVKLSVNDFSSIESYVAEYIGGRTEVSITDVHGAVEYALELVSPVVAKSYRDYRNYKQEFVHILDRIYKQAQRILFRGDRENANADSMLVSTKRCLTANILEKELYMKFFLTAEEIEAVKAGFIYIHDMSARRQTINCCLFKLAAVMRGGFKMGGIAYTEPKRLDTAGDVAGDIIISAAGQQYGGFTVPNVERVFAPYAWKSYKAYYKKQKRSFLRILAKQGREWSTLPKEERKIWQREWHENAWEDVCKDAEGVFQGLEYKLNTVASSRGDYPFVTFTFGNTKGVFEEMITSTILSVRKRGQGEEGHRKPVPFPKLVFLYDENLHGKGGELEYLFEEGLSCSLKTMYPDYLSLTGEGYVADIYKKYGLAISPMGCRAFLSPWWEKGGFEMADETDVPVFEGRFNIGVISLNLPLIYQEAKVSGEEFYTLLDYYLEMIRGIHVRTYDYLGKMKAGSNPLAYCEGGFLGGHLKPDDCIAPLLHSATASFGITALNELQVLHSGEMLHVENSFALEVMEYINVKVNGFKQTDRRLYAIYGTPAESLCGKQAKQFKDRFGVIPGVSDREYVSNSFHCHVTADITISEKQDLESQFWNYFNGGKISFGRYRLNYNVEALRVYIRRAMVMGLYTGVNLRLSFCNDCGYEALDMDVCPKCGKSHIVKMDRMNGYISYTDMGDGTPRFDDPKLQEIKERVSF